MNISPWFKPNLNMLAHLISTQKRLNHNVVKIKILNIKIKICSSSVSGYCDKILKKY